MSTYYVRQLSRGCLDASRFERDFRRRWPDHWDEFRADVLEFAVAPPKWVSFAMTIQLLLQNGFDANSVGFHREFPLIKAIFHAPACKADAIKYPRRRIYRRQPARRKIHPLESSEESSQECPRDEYEKWFLRIVSLIVGGADIHYIYPRFFDRMTRWSGLLTPSRFALCVGVFDDWRLALASSGRDPDDVFLEDDWRRKQAFRLRGATRTGIDEAILDPPPMSGLRCRRCRRRYCNNHFLPIFEQLGRLLV